MAKYKILYIETGEFVYIKDSNCTSIDIWHSKLKTYNDLINGIVFYNNHLRDHENEYVNNSLSRGLPLSFNEFEIVKVEGNKKRKL